MTTTYTTSYTYTHTVTYMADKLLLSLKNIVAKSGLSPAKLVDGWEGYERAITAWLTSGHLQEVILEVFKPGTTTLIGRWDLPVEYGTAADGFWFDPDEIYYEVRKNGAWPKDCEYRIVVTTKPGRPDVPGWGPATLYSTNGLVRQSVGTLIGSNGLKASAAHWRKA